MNLDLMGGDEGSSSAGATGGGGGGYGGGASGATGKSGGGGSYGNILIENTLSPHTAANTNDPNYIYPAGSGTLGSDGLGVVIFEITNLANVPEPLQAVYFSGGGGGLTNLNTTNLTGTLQAANFQPTTVTNFAAIGPLGSTSFSFTSHGGTLLITTDGAGSTSSSTGVPLGMTVSLDGTLMTTNHVFVNVASHAAFVAQTLVCRGVAAGSHTITLTAWNGTSTDLNDNFSVTVQELPF